MIPYRHFLSVLILGATSIGVCAADNAAPPNALRVVGSGNSFSGGSVSTFDEIVRLAGIKSATRVIYSGIGGSRVIQHWDLPDDKNVAKKALLEGNVDVMTMNQLALAQQFLRLRLKKVERAMRKAGRKPPKRPAPGVQRDLFN